MLRAGERQRLFITCTTRHHHHYQWRTWPTASAHASAWLSVVMAVSHAAAASESASAARFDATDQEATVAVASPISAIDKVALSAFFPAKAAAFAASLAASNDLRASNAFTQAVVLLAIAADQASVAAPTEATAAFKALSALVPTGSGADRAAAVAVAAHAAVAEARAVAHAAAAAADAAFARAASPASSCAPSDSCMPLKLARGKSSGGAGPSSSGWRTKLCDTWRSQLELCA